MTEKETFKKISRLLNTISEISRNEILSIYNDENTHLKIWKHTIALPRMQSREFFLILPDKNDVLDLNLSVFSKQHFIIDCFGCFSGENTITPRSFFVNFIFTSGKYYEFFNRKTNIDNRKAKIVDIDKYYISRTISIYNNEERDIFTNHESVCLEKSLEEWVTNGKKPLLILGERGIGKSWAALKFCKDTLAKHYTNPWKTPLPLYLNLRLLSESTPSIPNLSELVFYHLTHLYDLKIFGNHLTFSALLRTGMILPVFDGLDEMSKEVSDELSSKNLWQIFSFCSNIPKYLLTSRRNFFNSEQEIKEHFAYKEFLLSKPKNITSFNEIYKREETIVRQNINIWTIDQFTKNAKNRLSSKLSRRSKYLELGKKKLDELKQSKTGTIQREIYDLCSTPAYLLPVIRHLAGNQFQLIEIYENCIDEVVIDFNIETDRGIDSYKTIDVSNNTVSLRVAPFQSEKKNDILRKLSWYMVEREIEKFDINDFPKFIKEIEGSSYDVVLNDLQTQTVITLNNDESQYKFLNDGIWGFYIAKYLFLLLTSSNENEVIQGLQNLGRYNFGSRKPLLKAKIFLGEQIKNLINESKNNKFSIIVRKATEMFQFDSPYSPWLKCLSANLKLLDINIDSDILSKRDFWNNNPISTEENKTDQKMVLIPGGEQLAPFFLGTSEITNSEYLEFLQSDEFPGDENKEDCLGHYWKREEAIEEEKSPNNPYSKIINYYHLIFWKNGEIPKGYSYHPVVWVSWFAAAKFCNWLSVREKLNQYYKFEFSKSEHNQNEFSKVIINSGSDGYRLPSEREWKFAASEGNSELESIIDLYKGDIREKERTERKFKQFSDSTSPVKSENPNKFGVYGLMGNVREWVDDESKVEVTKFDPQLVKGMGWLLGKEGLKFNHISPLIAQNTNLDLGFRIARSLSNDETQRVRKALDLPTRQNPSKF